MKDEGGRMKDLKSRTKEFALRVIRLFAALPKTTEAQVIGKQLLRSGTSVGAHYREGMRARSDAEFISKIEGGLQELEESCYWMEFMKKIIRVTPLEGKIVAVVFSDGLSGSIRCRPLLP